MAWPNGTRLKTFAALGSFLPSDANNIEDRMLQIAGYRGKTIIAAEETRANAAYGKLTTPDEVTGIVVPTDGLLVVGYMALAKQAVGSRARAAIFVGAQQLQSAVGGTATNQQYIFGTVANEFRIMGTYTGGLIGGHDGIPGTPQGSWPATPFVLGGESGTSGKLAAGECAIFVAAGTYTVSVQFLTTDASVVTVRERKLWVRTIPFD